MIQTVVVGHGLAGRAFHCPLIRRQPDLNLHGIVARDPTVRAEAVELWQVQGFASLDEALDDQRFSSWSSLRRTTLTPNLPCGPWKRAGIAWWTR